MKKIMLLGDYSGNNTGHNALLISVINEFFNFGRFKFIIPTLKPAILKQVLSDEKDVCVVAVAPWNMSLKFLGFPVLRAIKEMDCILLTDNLFYDSNFFNVLKNNLIALRIIAPYAKRYSKPLVYYNSGVGPVGTYYGRKFIRSIAANMDLILIRDQKSKDLFQRLVPNAKIVVTADSGFSFPLQNKDPKFYTGTLLEGFELTSKGNIGINFSNDFIKWLSKNTKKRLSRKQIIRNLAQTLSFAAKENCAGLTFFVTHPRDKMFCEDLKAKLSPDIHSIIVEHKNYSAQDIVKIGSHLKCIVGTRYHELIMFACGHTPIIGVNYNNKIVSLFVSMELNNFLMDPEDFIVKKSNKIF